MMECKIDMGRKNSPMHYIPEQDPVQDALEKNDNALQADAPQHQNKLKVVLWVSGTLEQFLLHVRTDMDRCKQIDLDTKAANAMVG